jgi:sugar lactone lactonase YvrE
VTCCRYTFGVKATLYRVVLAGLFAGLVSGARAQLLDVQTLAGHPSLGTRDGDARLATFAAPTGIAVDSAGNIFLSDMDGYTIREITPGGYVRTIAGLAGHRGTADGVGSQARFYQPAGIALDRTGNIYVADSGNSTIRKITTTGIVTTFAGQAGINGSADGLGPQARFQTPYGIVVDGAGNIYVTDVDKYTIRQITPEGVVTTLAGQSGHLGHGSADGVGTAATFFRPAGITLDGAGNLYVGDGGNGTIRKITSTGIVTTVAGRAGNFGYTDGVGSDAQFGEPVGVATDGAGTVYVVDAGNNTIRKLAPNGMVTTLTGPGGSRFAGSNDGAGPNARFDGPTNITIGGDGNLYVADSGNNTIRKITPAGVVSTIAGAGSLPGNNSSVGSADGIGEGARFNRPYGVAVDSGKNVYVADTGNNTIRRISQAGVVTTIAGAAGLPGAIDGPGTDARFSAPQRVICDSRGTLYVSDSGNHVIRKISPQGVVTTLAGLAYSPGSADGAGNQARFNNPRGLAVDPSGNVYVADSGNYAIRRITPSGIVTTLAGLAGTYGSADGVGPNARFILPSGVALDSAGILYVADPGNYAIRKVAPDGTVTTWAGADFPVGIAIDNANNIYVVQVFGGILKMTPDGVATTIAGGTHLLWDGGSDDGLGSDAQMDPADLAVDADGNVYIADMSNNTVRIGIPASAAVTPASYLADFSVRADTGIGSDSFIVGFNLSGSGEKSLLLRGIGPGLRQFAISNPAQAPQIAVYSPLGSLLAANDGWSKSGTELTAIFSQVGEFALQPGSSDAAFVFTSTVGTYTALVAGNDGSSSIALAEIYDADLVRSARLLSCSGRARVGTGDHALIAGFVISGTASKQILIRGIGPGLSAFGVSGVLSNPSLILYSIDTNGVSHQIYSNTQWGTAGNSSEIASAASSVGAFAFVSGSADCALLVSLPPGAYTATVTGVNGATGNALVEVYDVR